MNGITILSTGTKEMSMGEQFYFSPNFSSFLGLVVIIALVVGCCLFILYGIKEKDESVFIGVGVCLLFILLVTDLTFNHQVTKTIPEYKVTIDKNVSLVEFYDKYIVLEQDDLIFTIINKDWENKDYNEVLSNNG